MMKAFSGKLTRQISAPRPPAKDKRHEIKRFTAFVFFRKPALGKGQKVYFRYCLS